MTELNPTSTADRDLSDSGERKTKIIEIVGCPGAGKTTLHNALCRHWSRKSKWIYPELLLSGVNPNSLFGFWSGFKLRKLVKRHTRTIPVDAGLKYIDSNKPLADFLWAHISGSSVYAEGEMAARFRSAYFLFKDFCFYQAIWDKQFQFPCIIDEGLLEKSFLVLDEEQAIVDLVDEYLSLVPMPHAVICLHTEDTEEIVARLGGRKKIIASHFGKSRDELQRDVEMWQFYFSIITEHLKKRNVPVFIVDALLPVELKVQRVNEIVSSLNNRQGR